MNKKKTIIVFSLASAFAYIFNYVYSMYSHGVSSIAMSNMWLVLLIGGVVVYSVLALTAKRVWQTSMFRLFYNLYNSGLAMFTVALMLTGIFEIAGTDSIWLQWFFWGSYGLIIAAVVCLILTIALSAHFYRSEQ